MYENSREDIMKGVTYWTEQIERAGLTDQLLPFNDVIVGNEPAAKDIEPMLKDVVLDGALVDIYHWDYPKRIPLAIESIFIEKNE
jgi:hypothetical protein